MHRLHASRTWKFVALYVAATMVVPYSVLSFPVAADAQAQPVVGSASVVVLPIQDPDGSIDSVMSQKATDALVLAMNASREYQVTSSMDLRRELQQLDLQPPLSVSEQVRLGDRLAVDRVATGEVQHLRINERTGQADVELSVAMLDVRTGEHLNGTIVSTTTKVIPGWQGERARVINDALREIAEIAVSELLRNRTAEGMVTSVNDFGVATINVGRDDNIVPGMEILLMRPMWQRDLEEMILVKVGRYSVSDSTARLATITPIAGDDGGFASVADRALRLYRGPERMQAHKRSQQQQHTLTVAAGVLALLGVVAVATGSASDDAPRGVRSHLYQQAPGDEAVIRVNADRASVPLDDQVFAWLFFRSEGQQNFGLMARNLVGAVLESRLPGGVWDDSPGFQTFEVGREFTWITAAGDEETGDIDLLFHAFPLQPGRTYYHRVQRIVEPPQRAGSGAPIVTSQIGSAQIPDDLDDPELSVSPASALGEGSKPTAGITYFTPPVLQSPEDGAQNQSTSSITFTWGATLGANEYLLEVFPEDDPDGVRQPRFRALMRQDTTGTMFHTITDNFAPSERFYWRVGARRSGEPEPESGLLGRRGWLYSSIRTFTTAAAPPPPPGSNAAGHSPGGDIRGGIFGQGRYHRPDAPGGGIR